MKKRMPSLSVVYDNVIVAQGFDKRPAHFMYTRALKPAEAETIVEFFNNKYKPEPQARIGG